MIDESVVVCDIETGVVGEKPDPKKDILRFVGFRDKKGNKVMLHASEKDKIQMGLNHFKFITGHNFKEYDMVVLKRYGFNTRSTIIDTLEIIDKRAKQMMYLDFGIGQKGLRYLLDFFKLSTQKGDIDYDVFKKNSWTNEELKEIEYYLFDDLDGSWDLFYYLYTFFEGFKSFVSPKDVETMKWLTASSGSTAYKVICNIAGLKEEYGEDDGNDEVRYQGAFVALPEQDYAEGNIYCIDYASLYPHMFMGGNLYSPSEEGWNGSALFPSVHSGSEDHIVGTYSTEMGVIEKTIQKLYNMRTDFKKEMKNYEVGSPEWSKLDAQQLATKIVINTSYGISGNPVFKHVFSLTTAADCTALARMCIKHARRTLTEDGYECLYTDTDSVYVLDPYKDEKRLLELTEEISERERTNMNIYIDSHFFEVEDKIKRMYFFKDDGGEYVKKFYIYVKENDKVVLKGLPIVKGNCSKLSVLTYEKHFKPTILSGGDVMVDIDTLTNWVRGIMVDNIETVVKRYRVNSFESYKSPSCIQAQISERYGAGEHYLVPNNYIGVGKGSKKATIDELKEEFGGEWIGKIDIRKYVDELRHFTDPSKRKLINLIDQDHTCKSFTVIEDLKHKEYVIYQKVKCRSCDEEHIRYKVKKSGKFEYEA